MEEGGSNPNPLLLHLYKLIPPPSEECLAQTLESLWSTRKTGLASQDRLRIQSLLNLSSSPQYLDPVVACFRFIIRKCTSQNLTKEDIQNILPDDVPVELKNILVTLLQKYQTDWMEESSKDPPLWQQQIRVTNQIKMSTRPALAPCSGSELLDQMWPWQSDPISGTGTTLKNLNYNQGSLPKLKSMTWTMEKRNSLPSNRLAIITLKLEDLSKGSIGEIEVKFQVSKDTLEAMLRSMVSLNEKLSNSVVQPSEKEE